MERFTELLYQQKGVFASPHLLKRRVNEDDLGRFCNVFKVAAVLPKR